MFCSTKRLKPTGGVTSAISTSSTTKIPNHTRSIPAFWIIGSTTAEVRTIIEIPSSAVPRTTYISERAAISAYGLRLYEATHSASARGIPVKAIVMLRKDAPARMNMIMHETRVAPMRLSMKLLHVRDLLHPAIASDPSTPYAAHSVAVAHPAISTQTMNAMRSAQGMRLPEALSFSRRLIGGSGGGVLSGFITAQQAM